MTGTEFVTERAAEIHERSVYTKRQAEVLALDEAGYTTDEIATELDISPVQVRRHVENADERLQQAAWTVMDSDVLVFSLTTSEGERMVADMDSILEVAQGG